MQEEINRCLEKLKTLEPGTDAYSSVLGNLWSLYNLLPEAKGKEPKTSNTAPKPETPPETQPEKPKRDPLEIRGAIAQARVRGVDTSKVIRSFGVDNFRDIPAERYDEVLAALEKGGD